MPRQLPAPPPLFTGRDREIAVLDKAMNPTAGTVLISAIGGLGGIGKTSLALHWAYQHRDQFPDGQLFVDLRGFAHGAEPLSPGAALAVLLDALGVPASELPADLEAQTGLYRTLLNDRRMLIVLDNARDTTQVTPLLPGTPACAVIVTSRDRLPGLATAYAASSQTLDMFDHHRAHDLLVGRLGQERLTQDPDAVADIIASCGGLPLALSIVAGRIAALPDHELKELAEDLRDTATRLSALDDGDPVSSVPAALSWSYAALPEEQATAFGLIGLVPGPDIGLTAAASLTGLPVPAARAVLSGLTRVCLLDAHAAGRWRMHDVVGLYAAAQASEEATLGLRRLVDHYLHTAAAGRSLFNPHGSSLEIGPLAAGALTADLADADAALAWFETEHACLLAIQRLALEHGWYDAVWQLASTLIPFHWRRGHVRLDVVCWQLATEAADRLGDPAKQITAYQHLGQSVGRTGKDAEGVRQIRRALAIAERIGDLAEQAQSHVLIAQTLNLAGREEQAVVHARQAVRLWQAIGNPVQEATALNSAGWMLARLGRYDEALAACEAALVLFGQHGHPDGQAATLDSLGLIAFRAGQLGQALEYYQQALAKCLEVGDTYNAADVLDRLAGTYLAAGRSQDATAAWREALGLYQTQERFGDVERMRTRLSFTG